MYLGIEIGGTKLQIGLGEGNGSVVGLWRGTVNVAAGGEGIRRQILTAIPELLLSARVAPTRLKAVGVGFGGPIDDAGQRIIKSHQISGWDDFPLAEWLSKTMQVPVALGNDADVAGLAEALHGAGRGHNPLFYITIGSGIGGGFVVDGRIFRGVGRGAAEIGHLRVLDRLSGCKPGMSTLEEVASGWGIEKRLRRLLAGGEGRDSLLWKWASQNPASVTTEMASRAAQQGDPFARSVLQESLVPLAEAINAVIVLLCPRRIVIGGGVALMGEELFFAPLRALVEERMFKPFAGLTEIVPAALGEAVVVHGALALAKTCGGN